MENFTLNFWKCETPVNFSILNIFFFCINFPLLLMSEVNFPLIFCSAPSYPHHSASTGHKFSACCFPFSFSFFYNTDCNSFELTCWCQYTGTWIWHCSVQSSKSQEMIMIIYEFRRNITSNNAGVGGTQSRLTVFVCSVLISILLERLPHQSFHKICHTIHCCVALV